jgi:N-acetylneuraminic acid mutarotase
MVKHAGWLIAIVMLLATGPGMAQTAAPEGAWTAKKPLPTARNEVSLAAVGGKVFVVGGSIGGNAVPLVDEYDPAADAWRSRAPMPKGLDHMGIAVLNGKIITVGGFIGSVHRGAVNEVYQYDPAADQWRALAPLKDPRGSVGATVLDGKVHAIGGRGIDNTFTVGTHEVYDPATDKWSERAPVPKARDHFAVVAIEGKIHAIGGRVTNPASRVDEHDVYDSKTNTWSAGPPLPTARSGLAALPGHDRCAGRRAAARHVCGKRGLRSEVDALAHARWNARRSSRHRRGGDRQVDLRRRRLAQARLGRRDRPVDRVHDALTTRSDPFVTRMSAITGR